MLPNMDTHQIMNKKYINKIISKKDVKDENIIYIFK